MKPDEIASVLYRNKPTRKDEAVLNPIEQSAYSAWRNTVSAFMDYLNQTGEISNSDRFLALCQGEMIDVDSKAFVLVQRTLTPDAQES